MPGGRLTGRDRERIAAGLAEGFGYAEIARQLGRPTSTVSREVLRNGGDGGYRADQAGQLTGQRARRRRPAPAAEPVPRADTYGRDAESVLGFVERFAELMVQTGLPRMAARVLASLVTTDDGALTAAELVRQLRVSPASVSKAVGYLEGLELVRRERDPRQRHERYVIDDDVWLQTWLTSAKTNEMLAETAQAGVEIFDAATPAGARLAAMRGFFAQLSEDMSGGSAFDDGLTVLAAFAQVAKPVAADQLAAALGWPLARVASALSHAGHRLTAAQRDALDELRGSDLFTRFPTGRA